MSWVSSPFDAPGDGIDITEYALYRQQDAYAASGSAVLPKDVYHTRGEAPLVTGWDYVGNHPARGDAFYQLVLPTLCDSVRALDQVVPVDYVVPGCPPEPPRVWEALQCFVAAFVSDTELPEPGSVLGAESMAVCEECPLTRKDRKIQRFFRPHEITPDPETCLLEQGLVCMGVATRAGCGALCPQVSMGCRGCYGPPQGVEDQGAKAVAAFSAIVETDSDDQDEEALQRQIDACVSTLVDPAGTFYRFSMAHSLLHRARTSVAKRGSKA